MKKIQYILLFTGILMVVAGCEKYLEQAPDMRTDLNSVSKVAQLLVSAYPKADYITFAEMASDNAEDRGPGIGEDRDEYTKPYMWEDFDGVNQGTTTYYWNNSYEAIAAANHALAAIEENGNGAEYQPYKGEALVARAYAHFMLVTFFAMSYKPEEPNNAPGIPYVTEPETQVVQQYDRGTVASVYEQIERDLLEGLSLINNSVYKVQKYHFNVAAANAFAARFFLFKGEYDKVIQYASAVIPSGDWVSNLRPWSTEYKNATSAEMQTGFTQSTQKPTLLLIEAASWWARRTGVRFGFGQTLDEDLFIKPNVTGKRFDHKIWNYGVPHYNLIKFKEHFHYTGPGIGLGYNMIPVLTVDEALMNRAEAYARQGQFDLALNDINMFMSTRIADWTPSTDAVTLDKVHDYYNITDSKDGLIQTILDCKRAEFIQEGLRWLDLVRLNLPISHIHLDGDAKETITTLEPGDPRRVFQIPDEAALSGVEKNPR